MEQSDRQDEGGARAWQVLGNGDLRGEVLRQMRGVRRRQVRMRHFLAPKWAFHAPLEAAARELGLIPNAVEAPRLLSRGTDEAFAWYRKMADPDVPALYWAVVGGHVEAVLWVLQHVDNHGDLARAVEATANIDILLALVEAYPRLGQQHPLVKMAIGLGATMEQLFRLRALAGCRLRRPCNLYRAVECDNLEVARWLWGHFKRHDACRRRAFMAAGPLSLKWLTDDEGVDLPLVVRAEAALMHSSHSEWPLILVPTDYYGVGPHMAAVLAPLLPDDFVRSILHRAPPAPEHVIIPLIDRIEDRELLVRRVIEHQWVLVARALPPATTFIRDLASLSPISCPDEIIIILCKKGYVRKRVFDACLRAYARSGAFGRIFDRWIEAHEDPVAAYDRLTIPQLDRGQSVSGGRLSPEVIERLAQERGFELTMRLAEEALRNNNLSLVEWLEERGVLPQTLYVTGLEPGAIRWVVEHGRMMEDGKMRPYGCFPIESMTDDQFLSIHHWVKADAHQVIIAYWHPIVHQGRLSLIMRIKDDYPTAWQEMKSMAVLPCLAILWNRLYIVRWLLEGDDGEGIPADSLSKVVDICKRRVDRRLWEYLSAKKC